MTYSLLLFFVLCTLSSQKRGILLSGLSLIEYVNRTISLYSSTTMRTNINNDINIFVVELIK